MALPFGRSKRLRRSVVISGVVLVVVVASGIGWAVHHASNEPLTKGDFQSPLSATYAWFASVNAHDMPDAQAHFAPADRDQMNWSSWGQPFTDLHCSLWKHSQSSAVVNCSFATQNDPDSGMSNVDGWSVFLTHEVSGRWLITTYGQG
jgi:hypothetical protein